MTNIDQIGELAKERFEVESFRPGQREVIGDVLAGHNVLAVFPTGHGKSLCYQLPALMDPEGTPTLVVSPLIALMRDQVGELRRKGISAADLHSGVPEQEQRSILEATRSGKIRLLYTSPERIQKKSFREEYDGIPWSRMAVDEAHCISEWGQDFRPEYAELGEFADQARIGQRLALTATASRNVRADIARSLGMSDLREIIGDLRRPNLRYRVIKEEAIGESFSDKINGIAELIEQCAPDPNDGVIIYCSSIKAAEYIEISMKRKGISAGLYHGQKVNSERKELEADFRGNRLKVLVATKAFGMGVDLPNIRLVVHWGVPGNVLEYLQETGRAGRDGKPSTCVLIYQEASLETQRRFIREKNPPIGFIRRVYSKLAEQQERAKHITRREVFPLNLMPVYLSCAVRKKDGTRSRGPYGKDDRIRRRDTEVNAAVRILRDHGILSVKSNPASRSNEKFANLGEFEEGSAEERLIIEVVGTRHAIGLATLDQMIRYAHDEDPSQELLLELLEEEVSLER